MKELCDMSSVSVREKLSAVLVHFNLLSNSTVIQQGQTLYLL